VYTNIFYFIIVLSVFSFYEPRGIPSFSWQEVLFSLIFTYFLFFVINSTIFRRFVKKYGFAIGREQIFATLHGKLINNCTVLAVGLYALFIYFFNLKFYVLSIPLLKGSSFAVNSLGLALFLTFLVIIWVCAFPSYQRFYDTTTSLKSYLLSHLRLNISLIVPWLFFSIVLDAIGFLPYSLVEPVKNNTYLSYFLFSVLLFAAGCCFPWLLVKIWNCKPLPHGSLRKSLEDFCKQAGFNYSDILLWNLFDGKIITAGVLGFVKKFRYLLISPSLLEILSGDELESVVAHEIGHVKNRHIVFYMFFILGYVIFAYAFFNIVYLGMLSQDIFLNFFLKHDGSIKTSFYIVPIIVLITFLLIYFRFLFGVFSRNFERQSDLHAIKIQGNGEAITSSLEKIASVGSHSRTASNWHHFSIQERINFLKECGLNHDLIQKHDRKVARIIALYFIALIVISGILYGINSFRLNQSELNLVQKVLERRLETEPENPSLHFILANVYYEKELFLKAENEYLITLAIKPYEPEALNNLAWLYATSEDENIKKPKEALKLSLLAARIDPQPHILDTLAESYFINGYYKEAVDTIRLAIAKKPENISYYKRQLEKFKDSLQRNEDREKKLQSGEYLYL